MWLARWLLCLPLLVGSCIYDPDKRCSEGERINADGYCVCEPNLVPRPTGVKPLVAETAGPLGRLGCVPCGAHQVIQGDTCVCEPGYTTADATGNCLKSMVSAVNFGAACTGDGDCKGPGATCITDDSLDDMTRPAYCSIRNCKDVSYCPAEDGFGCFQGPKGSFCRKPPAGEGDSCDDAMGQMENPACSREARACAFKRCTARFTCRGAEDCTPGLICCDLSAFPEAMGAKLCTTSVDCPVVD